MIKTHVDMFESCSEGSYGMKEVLMDIFILSKYIVAEKKKREFYLMYDLRLSASMYNYLIICV